MTDKVFNSAEQAKLKQIVNEGISIMQEVADLNGGLNDTIKAIAEEMEIKPSVLKKAIKVAFKAELGKSQQEHELLETILETVGKTA
jgi:hypothetical protein